MAESLTDIIHCETLKATHQRRYCADSYYRANQDLTNQRTCSTPAPRAAQVSCQGCELGRRAAEIVLDTLAKIGIPNRFYCLLCWDILRTAARTEGFKLRTGLTWGDKLVALQLLREDGLLTRKGQLNTITPAGLQVYTALALIYEAPRCTEKEILVQVSNL